MDEIRVLQPGEEVTNGLSVKVSVTDVAEFKDLVISCATFAYSANVSVEDFKAQARYLLGKMGVSNETYALGVQVTNEDGSFRPLEIISADLRDAMEREVNGEPKH